MTRGTRYQAEGFRRFSTGRLSRRPRRRAEGSCRGDPGNLWRQPSHPRAPRPFRNKPAMPLSHRRSSTAPNPTFQSGYSPGETESGAESSLPIPIGLQYCSIPALMTDALKVHVQARSASLAFAWAAASPMRRQPNCRGCRPRSAITAASSFASPMTSRRCRRNCISAKSDTGIPLSDVDTIRAKRPDVEIYVYPGAQHGFSCNERPSYDKASADIAWTRSLNFFAKHLKK